MFMSTIYNFTTARSAVFNRFGGVFNLPKQFEKLKVCCKSERESIRQTKASAHKFSYHHDCHSRRREEAESCSNYSDLKTLLIKVSWVFRNCLFTFGSSLWCQRLMNHKLTEDKLLEVIRRVQTIIAWFVQALPFRRDHACNKISDSRASHEPNMQMFWISSAYMSTQSICDSFAIRSHEKSFLLNL